MATDLDQPYHGWHHDELLGQEDPQDAEIVQTLDHGSISFGRYAVESLAWEKRSVFTHNRCQEELEKLKAPGLVAQKKAYFEEYYKRIRALKALQVSEQTELVLECGGDGNVSCQNGEVPDEIFGNEAPNAATACLEDHAAEVALEVESAGAFCCRQSGQKSTVACPNFSAGSSKGDISCIDGYLNNEMVQEPAGTCTNSSTRSFKEIDIDKNSIDSHQCKRFNPESSISYNDSQRTDIEDTDLKKNCSNALPTGHMPKDSMVFDSQRREEIELFKCLSSDDDKWSVKETLDIQHSVDTVSTIEHYDVDSPVLKPTTSELAPADNHTIGKAKVLIKKPIEHSSTPRKKESVYSVMKKTEYGMKPEAVKVSQRPKHLLQKTILLEEKTASTSKAPSRRLPSKSTVASDSSYRPYKAHSSLTVVKEGNDTRLRKAPSNRLPSQNKTALVLSNRPLKKSPSNDKILYPLPFATRQATTPGSIRERGPQNSHSKSLDGSIHASQQVFSQSTSVRRHAANGVKTASLEKKSDHGGTLKTSSVLNSHSTVSRPRDRLVRRPEARSSNLPGISKYNLTDRAGSGIKGEGLKEGKPNARSRLVEGTSKLGTASLTGTNKPNLRKQVPSRPVGLLPDGKKSRQEVKPWRL